MNDNNDIYEVAARVFAATKQASTKEATEKEAGGYTSAPDRNPPVAYGKTTPLSSTVQHFPLRWAYLCGSCDAVSNSSGVCPACASNGHQLPLTKFVAPVADHESN
jgi:hypothetical protein